MTANYTLNGTTLARKIPTLNSGDNTTLNATNTGFFLYNSVESNPIVLTIDVTNVEPGHHWELELITRVASLTTQITGPPGTRVRIAGITSDPIMGTMPFEAYLVLAGVPIGNTVPGGGVYAKFYIVEPVDPGTTDVELRIRNVLTFPLV